VTGTRIDFVSVFSMAALWMQRSVRAY